MAYDEQFITEALWGSAPSNVNDWWLGCWLSTGDVVNDLANTESSAARVNLGAFVWNGGSGWFENVDTVTIGPFGGEDINGWFITQGETNLDITFVSNFTTTPLTLEAGEYLVFDPGTIQILVTS